MPAVSKAQQRFMGMVHAAQKGEEPASPEVAKVAADMKKKDAKDFASTKHKGLPMHKETISKERLKELVKEVMVEEAEYQQFFKKALAKAGKSIPEMSDDEKKAFFDKIDTAWNNKGEKNEDLKGDQHKLDVDGDGDIEGDDLADLRAGKKVDEGWAPGPYVGLEMTPTGPKLVKTFSSGTQAYAWVMKSGGGYSIMTKKQWDVSESVNEADIAAELPKAAIPSAVKQRLTLAIDKIKDAKLSNVQKLQLVAQVVDAMGIDKTQLGQIATRIRSKMESIKK